MEVIVYSSEDDLCFHTKKERWVQREDFITANMVFIPQVPSMSIQILNTLCLLHLFLRVLNLKANIVVLCLQFICVALTFWQPWKSFASIQELEIGKMDPV